MIPREERALVLSKVMLYISNEDTISIFKLQKYLRLEFGLAVDIIDELVNLRLISKIDRQNYQVLFKYR